MPSDLDLTVIVLSFNTKQITDECLSCLKKSINFSQKQLKNSVQTIVVDNASTDGSLAMLRKKHRWAQIIASKTNTGFSGGNNLAMKQAKTPFILLLNSDAFVKEETLVKALKFFADHPDSDIIGPQLRFGDGRLQPSAGFLPNPVNTIFWISGLSLFTIFKELVPPIHPKDPKFFSQTQQVDWVMGAFFMLKRIVYETTGGFDESIFMYGEEVEWSKRIKNAGFKTYYVPQFTVTHLDKASSKFMLDRPLLNEIKAIVRYFHQHYRSSYFLIKPIMFVFLLARFMAFTLLNNRTRAKAYKEALSVL